MPGTPRRDIFDPETVGVYHCYSRCTQRAFLCGFDPFTGTDFSHRKDWIRDRLREMAGLMAMDVLDYAVLDNHLHVVVRNRPDISATWSDEEVVRRWWQLCPLRREADGRPGDLQAWELKMLLADGEKVDECRRRLSDLSWWMRLLCQPIARRANKESNVTGRFFAHRFGCERILDEAGLLACSIYVDLNAVRAGVAQTPETSEFSSAFDRIRGRWQRHQRELGKLAEPLAAESEQDAWLAPLFLDEAAEACEPSAASGSSAAEPVCVGNPFPSPRASEKGFLPLTLDEYLELLDWTGRQMRDGKRGVIPAHLAPIMERVGVNPDHWLETVGGFGSLFRTAVGRLSSMRAQATRMGRRWLSGIRGCAASFL